jgi:ATP-binding cassette subfamily F protein uup
VASAPEAAAGKKQRRLSNKERAELAALPARIEALESEQTALNARLADPAYFRTAGAEVTRATARLDEIEAELAKAYARWTELEG